MKLRWLFLSLAAAGLVVPGVTRAIEVDFSRDTAEGLFETAEGTVPKVSDGFATLTVRAGTHLLPVVGGKKYKLEIVARAEGDFVVEENDRAHILTLQSHQHRLSSTCEVVFQNADRKEIPGFGADIPGARTTPRLFFLTKQLQTSVAVFYAPQDATGLRLRFRSNDRITRIASLRLAEETEENSLIPNPDFRYGELSYSGWHPQRDGRLYTRPDGKTVFHAGYGGSSPFFPLAEGITYEVTATGTGEKDKATIQIQYFDKDGKSLLTRFLIRPDPKGATTRLTPPPGTASAWIVLYGVILEEFRINRVN